MLSFPLVSMSQAQPLPNLRDTGLRELLLESIETAERRLDRVGQRPGRGTTGVWRHPFPERRMIHVAATVVADRRPDVLGNLADVPQKILDALRLQIRILLERGIQVRHICLVMLPVMDLHGLRIDMRLERIEAIRKRWKLMGHDCPPLSCAQGGSRAARPALPTPSMNGKHPIERDLRPVLLLVGNSDSVVNLTLEKAFEHPQQMVRGNAEHRRAQAPELIEGEHRLPGFHALRKSIDEVKFCADRPDRSGPSPQ